MATFLDIGLLDYFNVVFAVLLVFAVLFALLQRFKLLGESIVLNAIVAIAVAFLFLLSRTLIDLVNFIAPWFVFVFVFLVLLLLIFHTLGATEGDVALALKSDKIIQWAVVGVAIVILIAGFGKVFGQTIGPYLTEAPEGGSGVATASFEQNVFATIFHPKVLGLIVLFGVAIFAVVFLSGSAK